MSEENAYRILFQSDLESVPGDRGRWKRRQELKCPEVDYFLDFIRSSERGASSLLIPGSPWHACRPLASPGSDALGLHHARARGPRPGGRQLRTRVYFTDVDRGALPSRCERSWECEERSSLDELLEASDAVVVAVPTLAHETVALQAIRDGIHVFVEKPMAPDAAAAGRMITAARQVGVVLQVGHVERFNPALVAARPYLDRPLFVESHRLAPFTPRSLDVTVVLDLMIHDVDLLCTLVGKPVTELAAAGVPVLTRHVDVANARIGFEGRRGRQSHGEPGIGHPGQEAARVAAVRLPVAGPRGRTR